MSNVIDIRQSATVTQLQEELMFAKGQNQALFAMLSYLTEHMGNGYLTIPANYGELIAGSNFFLDRDGEGNYILSATREPVDEQAAPSEQDATTTIE